LNGTAKTSQLIICDSSLQQFCALSDTAALWYYIGYAGSAVVVLGLIHFMICLAANYAHIKDGSKYVELQEIWQENEMTGPPPAGYMAGVYRGQPPPKF